MPPSSPSLSLLDNLLILPSASFILGIVFIDTIYDQPSLPLSTRKLYYSTNKETKGLPGWYLGVIQVASLGSFGGVLGGTLGRYWLGEYSKERGGGNRGLVDVAGLVIALTGAQLYTSIFVPNSTALTSTPGPATPEDEPRLAAMKRGHGWVTLGLLAIVASRVARNFV